MKPHTTLHLGKTIAALRKSNGLTQKELANQANVAITAVRRCEQQGKISLAGYVQLIAALKAQITIVGTAEPKYRSLDEVTQTSGTKPAREPRLGSIFNPA